MRDALPEGLEDLFQKELKGIKEKYINDVNKGKTRLTDKQLLFFSKNMELKIEKQREIEYLNNIIQVRAYFKVDKKTKEEYYDFLKRFIE